MFWTRSLIRALYHQGVATHAHLAIRIANGNPVDILGEPVDHDVAVLLVFFGHHLAGVEIRRQEFFGIDIYIVGVFHIHANAKAIFLDKLISTLATQYMNGIQIQFCRAYCTSFYFGYNMTEFKS